MYKKILCTLTQEKDKIGAIYNLYLTNNVCQFKYVGSRSHQQTVLYLFAFLPSYSQKLQNFAGRF